MSEVRCPWWRAWSHRRKRRIDHAVMWPVLRGDAVRRHPHDEEVALIEALRAWTVFITTPGQEHWLCPCAERDALRPMRED